YTSDISSAASDVYKRQLEHNLIRAIRDARLPGDLHGFPLPSMSSRENKNNRNGAEDELVGLFREMKYYE
ncbi:hypothetical protein ACP6D5_31885, partial [Klebsiella pneumoniae subsp. pneumoniae]